jgi:pimeloyl-ACP methyl ester carboxylesterase
MSHILTRAAVQRCATISVLLLALVGCGSRASLATPSVPQPAPAPMGSPRYMLYTPSSVPATGPLRLLIALHGIGGNGSDFAKSFMPIAAANGWLLAAPTFSYGNWFDPVVVRREDVALSRQLVGLIEEVQWETGRTLLPRVDVVGFSRGAQVADRFAMFYPERVEAVGSLSAGTYTLPEPTTELDGDGFPLPLPFGTSDMPRWLGHSLDTDELRRVRFWISVGGSDDNPGDIPRQWDPLLGDTRVTRARSFTRALEALDVPARLIVYPGADHRLTEDMADDVSLFLAGLSAT